LCPQTAVAAYKRYVFLKPDKALEYLDFLLCHDMLEECLRLYIVIINDESQYLSKSNKSKFDLTLELCQFISKYPSRAKNLGSDIHAQDLLRKAIADYP
jgi:hypothetical protein